MKEIKTKRKIRIAVVGCGRISEKHFNAIEIHKQNMELVSICDINQQVLVQSKDKYKVNAYHDLEQMLKKEELDLVSLCTPSGIHANQTELCAQYGVNVITEKPMARGNQLEERVCRGL